MASMADRKSEWFCGVCGVKIALFVTPSEPPSHFCKKQKNQPITLTKKEKA